MGPMGETIDPGVGWLRKRSFTADGQVADSDPEESVKHFSMRIISNGEA